MALGSFASSTASAFWPLFVFMCIFGIGFSMSFSSLPKLVGLWFPAKKVGLATGIYVTGIAIGVAIALGITRSVIFPITNSYQGTFFIWSIPLAVGAILWCSPSAARRFADSGLIAGGAVVACIGPTTATAAEAAGMEVECVADEANNASLVIALSRCFAPAGASRSARSHSDGCGACAGPTPCDQ